jgi:hypothetical protein
MATALILDRRTPGTPEMMNGEITGQERLEQTHNETGASAPFLLPDDPNEEIAADLAAMGITSGAIFDKEEEYDQAQREAVAATFLDHASRHATRADELAQARDHQLAVLLEKGQRIRDFYAAQIKKQNDRRDELLRYVEHLASISIYHGKKKSIDTPFGTFGFKDVAPSAQLVDEAQALTWAKSVNPEYVQVTAKLGLNVAVEYLTDAELAECKQTLKWGELKKRLDLDAELPPGITKVEGGRQFYAKIDTR